jgi:hypothetical protein
MTTVETTPMRQRAPRGSRTVSQAFFAALDAIPEARRQEVAKAAQAAIREELKSKLRKQVATRRRVSDDR